MNKLNELRVAIIGLGYVGLPLAAEFAKFRNVLGFDINEERIFELSNGFDRTEEVGGDELGRVSKNLYFTSNAEDLQNANCFIVTVPTPIDKRNTPDLTPLINASRLVGMFLKQEDIVIYESTVYPGCTEEVCIPILESISGLKLNLDFSVGYSPERINPGDKLHRVSNIKKITSGSNIHAANLIDDLYCEIVKVGTHKAPNIKVAEAAKVIENTQRDVNIALVNELAILFARLGIDTEDVLLAAGSKWNFLPFRPGLVGGHCIGVDPYYLTYKAQMVGYTPEIILAGRRINDEMGRYVAGQFIKGALRKGLQINGMNVLVLGLSFKENCPDIRNTRVVDIVGELKDFGCKVDVYDPRVNQKEALDEYKISLIKKLDNKIYQGMIFAVAHEDFKVLKFEELKNVMDEKCFIYDLKHIIPKEKSDLRL